MSINKSCQLLGHARSTFFEVRKNQQIKVEKEKLLERFGQFDDLLKGISITRPEQIWVADITYFRTQEGFIYGHLITDAYSKKIMGAVVAGDMKATTTLLALKMALKNRQNKEPLIHHSDRGFQYLSKVYTNHLKKNKIKISVTQNGSPYDNPVAERINGILKDEFNLGSTLKNLQKAKQILEKAMHIYNEKRPHWSNHLLTPNQMHNQQDLEMITWNSQSENTPTG